MHWIPGKCLSNFRGLLYICCTLRSSLVHALDCDYCLVFPCIDKFRYAHISLAMCSIRGNILQSHCLLCYSVLFACDSYAAKWISILARINPTPLCFEDGSLWRVMYVAGLTRCQFGICLVGNVKSYWYCVHGGQSTECYLPCRHKLAHVGIMDKLYSGCSLEDVSFVQINLLKL